MNRTKPDPRRDLIMPRCYQLETALRAAEAVWNLRRQQGFYDLVVQEIAAASPEVAQSIVERLAALDARTGMAPIRV